MKHHPARRLRRYISRSPLLQILLFVVGLIVFLLLAERSGAFGG